MDEILKIINKYLADNLLESCNPRNTLNRMRKEIESLGRLEPLVMPKIAEIEAKCKEEITWVDSCFEDMAKGTEYAVYDKPYLEGMRNVAVKILKIIDSNFSV